MYSCDWSSDVCSSDLVIYLDDILIFTHTIDQLDRLTRKVLEHLERHDLFLKPEKCFFNQKSIEYLGVIISKGQVKMDQAKSTRHSELAYPKDVEERPGLPWFLQLLSPFCSKFFRHRTPTVTAHEEGYSDRLGRRSGKSVSCPHHCLHHSASIGSS